MVVACGFGEMKMQPGVHGGAPDAVVGGEPPGVGVAILEVPVGAGQSSFFAAGPRSFCA
jgi:hypothetical protein